MPIGPFARLVCHVCCFLYPAYASYKALSLPAASPDGDAGVERWLMYWAVVGTWTAIESTVGWVFTWIPFYSVFKLAVFLYFSLPQTQGSTIVYERLLAPIFAEHERDIDSLLLNLRTQSTSALADGVGYAWNKISQQLNIAPPVPYRTTPTYAQDGHEQYAAPPVPPPSFQDPVGGTAQKLYGLLGHYAGQYLPVAATAPQAAAAAATNNSFPRAQAQAAARQVQETLSMPVPQPTPGVGAGGSRAMQYATLGETSARAFSGAGLHPRSVSSSSSGQPGLHQHDSSESIRSRSSRSSLSGQGPAVGQSGPGQGSGGDMSSYENISHDEVPLGGFEVPSGQGHVQGKGPERPSERRRTSSWFGRGTPEKSGKAE